jgi:hypothetical protein
MPDDAAPSTPNTAADLAVEGRDRGGIDDNAALKPSSIALAH